MVLLCCLRVRFSDVPLSRPAIPPYEQTTVVCGVCRQMSHNKIKSILYLEGTISVFGGLNYEGCEV